MGAAVGALVAALVARNQFVGARREQRLQLERRDTALERSKKEEEAHRSEYARRSEDYLRELSIVRRERGSLAVELEETRRTLTTLQGSLETLRASARDAESRLGTALEAARQDAAARRATAAEELTTVQESAHRSRTELSRRIADLENDRSRLETELAAERRANAEKQESLRSIVTALREQYTLASSERDTFARELEEERKRADEAEAGLRRTREESSKRLDAEHQESMELISRVWEYVHNYVRSRPADLAPEVESPEVPATGTVGRAKQGARAGAEAAAPATPPEPAAGPLTTDREVETPHARTMGDRCPDDDYDIERALEEVPASTQSPSIPPSTSHEATPAPSQPSAPPQISTQAGAQARARPDTTVERGWRSVTPPWSGTMRVRKPVSAMRRGDDVLVICDDGSVWLRRPTGWIEQPPIPGSVVNGEKGPPPGDVTSGAPPG